MSIPTLYNLLHNHLPKTQNVPAGFDWFTAYWEGFFSPHMLYTHIYCKHMQFGIRCVLSAYHWAARTQPLSVCVICMNCTSLLQTGGMSRRRQRLNTIFHYSPYLYIIKQMASLFKNKKNRSAASRLAACSRPCTDPATVLSVMWAITWLFTVWWHLCI